MKGFTNSQHLDHDALAESLLSQGGVMGHLDQYHPYEHYFPASTLPMSMFPFNNLAEDVGFGPDFLVSEQGGYGFV